MKVIDSHYIDGSWRAAESADRIQVINPTSEEVMGGVPAGTPQEVDHAAGAASSAFETWSAVPVTERVTLLRAVAAGLSERSEEAAQTLTPISTQEDRRNCQVSWYRMVRPSHQGTRVSAGRSALRRTGEKARRSSRTVMVLASVVIWPGVSRKRRWMVSGVAAA